MIEKTMILVTSAWGQKKTFRMIPVHVDCPYSEGIYDPDSKVLVLMGVLTKESFHMLPRLNDDGDQVASKMPRTGGKRIKEQRVALETFSEYYITEKDEIINMIELITINAEAFNFKQYLTEPKIIVTEIPKLEIVKK